MPFCALNPGTSALSSLAGTRSPAKLRIRRSDSLIGIEVESANGSGTVEETPIDA